ncbi:MAG TPA: Rrf2 family transcriptional regulator [Bryobacteraceae bacterium]|jgi:Rrf2 family protein
MKLSSHEEYGLRCLLQVARQGADGSATIAEISRNEGISIPYVAKLMRILRLGGFVEAARGRAGGYTLALPSERICIGDALTILGGRIYEESFCRRHSGTQRNCAHSTNCSIRSLWCSVQGAVDSVLRTTTVGDLLRNGHDAVVSGTLETDLISLRNRTSAQATPEI